MKGRGSLFGDARGVCFGLRKDSAGELEVMQYLLASHSGVINPFDLWLGRNVFQLAFGVQPCTVLCSGDALEAARMSQIPAIGYKPAFAVG
ncbi:MAG: hypothetical protein ABI286_07075 [Edaphobacter sp.]